MEFEIKHKLRFHKETITVLVDAAGDDCVVSPVIPPSFGVDLESLVQAVWLDLAEIEEAAWESYRARLDEIRCEKA